MCEICIAFRSEDPAKRTDMRDGLLMNAERMERMASVYRDLAHQTLKPHTEKMQTASQSAHSAIRQLVEDFL